jgi:acetyl esterase/lipase
MNFSHARMLRPVRVAVSYLHSAQVPSLPGLLPGLRALVVIAIVLALGGCTGAKLFVANVPGWFGSAERSVATYAPATGLQLDVYRPAGPVAEPRPVIVFVHGGAWQYGTRRQYAFVGHTLAGEGYVAVLPDYRKYPAVRFPAFVDDVAAAVAWTAENIAVHGGDPGRVFLMGHSAGAHMAMLTVLDPAYLAAAGVGADVVRGVIGLAGPYDFALESARLRDIFSTADTSRDYRPLVWVQPGAPPVLLVHGTADSDVDPRNSVQLAKALRAAGVPVTVEFLDGLDHGAPVAALSPVRRNLAPVLPAIEAFTEAHGADAACCGPPDVTAAAL